VFDIPNWSMVSNPAYFDFNDRSRLLITSGDSWTYGDSLGKTKVRLGIDDTGYRLDHVYGRIISNELDRDWINLALPGISNSLLLRWLDKLLSEIQGYNDIICSINLTETGRHEDLHSIAKDRSMHDNLRMILAKTYSNIEALKSKNPSIRFIDSIDNSLGYSWLETMLDREIQNDTHILLSEHISQMNQLGIFSDVNEIIDKALKRIDLLDSCVYCNEGDSRHPNEMGHQLWAYQLLKHL